MSALSQTQIIQKRYQVLNTLRGFAICGILFVNMPSIFAAEWPQLKPNQWHTKVVYDLFIQNRFFPLFCLIFGVGFAIFWSRLQAKTSNPRLIMMRRFLTLLIIGALHQILQPGEALLPYALTALIILLPLTFIPEKYLHIISLTLGLIILIATIIFIGNGPALIPSLFLIGTYLGLPTKTGNPLIENLETLAKWHPIVAVITTLLSAIGIYISFNNLEYYLNDSFIAILGITMMTGYVFWIITILNTSLGSIISSFFSPLGRMALTNYVSATIIMHIILIISKQFSVVWDDSNQMWLWMTFTSIMIIVFQWVISTLYLQYFKQGPLEKIWRDITYWRISSWKK